MINESLQDSLSVFTQILINLHFMSFACVMMLKLGEKEALCWPYHINWIESSKESTPKENIFNAWLRCLAYEKWLLSLDNCLQSLFWFSAATILQKQDFWWLLIACLPGWLSTQRASAGLLIFLTAGYRRLPNQLPMSQLPSLQKLQLNLRASGHH